MELVEPIRSKEQIEEMKEYLRDRNMRDYCLFVLGINSGLRVSDLLNLKVADVVNEKGEIQDRILLTEQKTGKRKDFPLGSTAKLSIREYLSVREQYALNEPLFISGRTREPLGRWQAWKALSRAAEEVGITENIGTHTLRKTFGYHAYQAGKDITVIQKLLNHSSPAITLSYIGITRDDMDSVYLSLEL